MNLSFPQLLTGTIGIILIYSAVKNVMPQQVIKDTLSKSKTKQVPHANGFIGPTVEEIQPAARYKQVPHANSFIGPTVGEIKR